MSYNFDRLNLQGASPFFDTGTTFLYLPPDLMARFTAEFASHCSTKSTNCAHHDSYRECYYYDKDKFHALNDFFKSFPVMKFFLNDTIEYKWHPQDYLVQPLDSTTHYCVGVKTLSHTIFGAIFMRNYDIYFDRTSKQIGFARSNCGSDPFFVDDLSKKPDENSTPIAKPAEPEVISPAEMYMTPAVDTVSKKARSKSSFVNTEEEGSNTKLLIILAMLVVGIIAGLAVLRNLWKQSRNAKDVKSEVNMSIDLTEEEA